MNQNRRELKQEAKEEAAFAGKHAKLMTLIFLIAAAVTIGIQYLAGELIDRMDTHGNYLSQSINAGARSLLLSLAVGFLLQMALRMLWAGYIKGAIRIHRRENLPMSTLTEGFYTPIRVILLEVLESLMLVAWSYALMLPVSFLLSMGMGMVMSPEALEGFISDPMGSGAVGMTLMIFGACALIMLIVSYRYRMGMFLLMDHPELTPFRALRVSSAMTRGHRMELFLLDLSFLPWGLLCGLTAGILLIFKAPYFAAAYAGFYDRISGEFQEKQERMLEELRQRFPPNAE